MTAPLIVPWFSRHEWFEVFKGAYGNDIDKWKEARDTMLVWQARVSKLPIGVDLTIPLLQAKIVNADPYVDEDVKSIMQGSALQRFVSSVVKLPQSMYYHNQTLHMLAANIGLPAHLVDLRNEIIHGDCGWVGGCTISNALETAFEWVKGYYWQQECRVMKNKRTKKNFSNMLEDRAIIPKLLKDFKMTCNSYSKVLRNDYWEIKAEHRVKALRQMKESFKLVFANDPDACIEMMVTQFLFRIGTRKTLRNRGKRAKCGCYFKSIVVKRLHKFLFFVVCTKGALELLLCNLLSNVQENESYVGWIELLVLSVLNYQGRKMRKKSMEEETGYCTKHLLVLHRSKVNIEWQQILQWLLNLEEDWALSLGVSIVKSPASRIPELQAKKIMDLVNIKKHGEEEEWEKEEEEEDEEDKNDSVETPDTSDNTDLFNLETIMDYASENMSEGRKVSARIKSMTLMSPSDCCKRMPLGILPHQKYDKIFYKDLLLCYPKDSREPTLKRKRMG